MAILSKTPAQSITEQCHIVFSGHINGNGRLFGGQLIEWMDVAAAVAARRHCEYEVTTVSIHKVDFTSPAMINDLVVLRAKLVYAGTTSMYVKVEAFVEKPGGARTVINRAVFVLVALDENDAPVKVPALIPVTEEEKAAFAEWALRKKGL